MNKSSLSKRAAIVGALIEGASIRSVSRMTGASKGTILRLLAEVGEFCETYQDVVLSNLPTVRIEMDETWAFCNSKEKNATKEGQGDLWTYVALDADSKLVVSWLVGRRSGANTQEFVADVARRLARRVQATTDGLAWYVSAVENAFGWNRADFAQLIKTYGATLEQGPSRKYSPMECTGAIKTPVMGKPDMAKVSTSYVERFNLQMRMTNRRMTRLTNGFSKKAENHAFAIALQMMSYNFMRAHGTLTKARGGIKQSPAMAAGVTTHVWTVEELLQKMEGMIGAEKP